VSEPYPLWFETLLGFTIAYCATMILLLVLR